MAHPLTNVRLDPKKRAAVEVAATRSGQTVSDFIRAAIDRELDARKSSPTGRRPR